MSTDNSQQPSRTVVPDWRATVVVTLLLAVLFGGAMLSAWWGEQAKKVAAGEAARAAVEAKTAEQKRAWPPPKLRRGKPILVKGKKMANFVASGAGTAAYNDVYVESGTHNGKAAYQGAANSKWLWWHTAPLEQWILSAAKDDTESDWFYYCDEADLPGAVWHLGMAGAADPPTVAAFAYSSVAGDSDPYNLPYDNNWWGGAAFAAASPIAPGLVTIGGTLYVCFISPNITTKAILLYDPATGDWNYLDTAAAIFANYDTGQGGGLFDCGDGVNAWFFSGGYVRAGSPYFLCDKYNLFTGAEVSTQEVALEAAAATITNMAEVTAGSSYRFLERDTTTLRLHSYTAGGAAYTELAEWVAGAWPGLPVVGWTEPDIDGLLYRSSGGDLYYLRRFYAHMACVPYRVDAAGAARLPWFNDMLSGFYATIGEYRDQIVYSPSTNWGPVNDSYTWTPDTGVTRRPDFAAWPMGRYWYLTTADNSTMYVAGWGQGAAAGIPFVLTAAAASITVPAAILALEAKVPSFAQQITVPVANLTLEAKVPAITAYDIINVPVAPLYAMQAQDISIVGSANRAASANTSQWTYARVRAGA